MSVRELLSRATRRPVRGRALERRRRTRIRTRSRRDAAHSSDEVWRLVEQMMQGDADAAVVLTDLIQEGVRAGDTQFVQIARRAYKRQGRTFPEEVKPNAFAAITPGRSIVLFGMNRNNRDYVMKGYMRRFRVGDVAERGSYNLVYMGPIRSITPKRVTIEDDERTGRTKSLDIEQFHSMNWDFDLERAKKQNREWTD